MCFNRVLVIKFNNGNCNVGAVVGGAFKIVDTVIENKACLQRANALLQTFDVPLFQILRQSVHNLLKGLNVVGGVHIVVNKSLKAEVENLLYCRGADRQFGSCRPREAKSGVVHFEGKPCNVFRVVGNTLKVCHATQKFGGLTGFVQLKLLCVQADQKLAELVFKFVLFVFP